MSNGSTACDVLSPAGNLVCVRGATCDGVGHVWTHPSASNVDNDREGVRPRGRR